MRSASPQLCWAAALAALRPALRFARPLVLLPGLAVGLAGCNGTPAGTPPATRRPLYFDVKGLLDGQVKALAARAPAVTKQVQLRGGATETVRVPAVRWPDELQIFYQADINKAALRGAYAADSVRLPDGRLRRRYTRRPGQRNAPVSQLTVLLAGGQAQEIAADIDQENTLFSTNKHLTMELSAGQLRRYRVQGTQKLVFFDTLRYGAAGRIEAP